MFVIDRRAAAQPDHTVLDSIAGAAYGTGVSIIIEDTDVDGAGPFLHQHPYAETFVIHRGRARFRVGDEELTGEAGMVLVVPELTSHAFSVIGPERYLSTHIHSSDRFITEWLEGPRAR